MSDPSRLSFDFEGARLHVLTHSRRWADKLREGYKLYLATDTGSAGFTLRIEEAEEPRVPTGIPHSWSGLLLEGGKANIYETEERWALEALGRGFVCINWRECTAYAESRPGAEDIFSYSPMNAVVDAAIAAGGQQLLHAACLGRRNDASAFILCAPSGAGKTTAALALAHEGFRFLADDTSVVIPRENSWQVWGIPNVLKIHRDTQSLLPWLPPLPDTWNSDGEQAVRIDTIRHAVPVAKTPPMRLEAIFMLGARSNDGHVVRTLSRAKALVRIAHDNISGSPTGVKPWSHSQFSTYAALVRDTAVFEIHAGRDVASLADCVEHALDDMFVGAGRS